MKKRVPFESGLPFCPKFCEKTKQNLKSEKFVFVVWNKKMLEHEFVEIFPLIKFSFQRLNVELKSGKMEKRIFFYVVKNDLP